MPILVEWSLGVVQIVQVLFAATAVASLDHLLAVTLSGVASFALDQDEEQDEEHGQQGVPRDADDDEYQVGTTILQNDAALPQGHAQHHGDGHEQEDNGREHDRTQMESTRADQGPEYEDKGDECLHSIGQRYVSCLRQRERMQGRVD